MYHLFILLFSNETTTYNIIATNINTIGIEKIEESLPTPNDFIPPSSSNIIDGCIYNIKKQIQKYKIKIIYSSFIIV